jgi:hypothetical protein
MPLLLPGIFDTFSSSVKYFNSVGEWLPDIHRRDLRSIIHGKALQHNRTSLERR